MFGRVVSPFAPGPGSLFRDRLRGAINLARRDMAYQIINDPKIRIDKR